MAFNLNINCDNVDMEQEKLTKCNFTARLLRLPIGVFCIIFGLIFIMATSDWVPKIIGSVILIAGLGFFAVLIFNGRLSEWEWKNNQAEIESHMSMRSIDRATAIAEINNNRVAHRQPVYSRPIRNIPAATNININV